MCPKVLIESSSLLPGRGPKTARASSSKAASEADHRISLDADSRVLYRDLTSSSVSFGSAAFINAWEPNTSFNSCEGVSTGHIQSKASLIAIWPLSLSSTVR